MKKFQRIAVAFFLFVSLITFNNLFAQQKDTSLVVPGQDSITNITPDEDSLFYGKNKAKPDTAIVRESKKGIVGFGDTTIIVTDKKKKERNWSRPKTAMVWAMVLPGAGQAYNRKFWKMPILYVGAGVLAYYWITNQRGYSEFNKAYDRNYDILLNDPSYQVYEDNLKYGSSFVYTSIDQLATERDTYRRYRDMSIAGSVILYTISILDAYVDAHLSTFDLNPDLSLSVKPMFYNYNNVTFAPGLSLSLNFKNNRISKNQLIKRVF
jgi:hypothetical protein